MEKRSKQLRHEEDFYLNYYIRITETVVDITATETDTIVKGFARQIVHNMQDPDIHVTSMSEW
jgi:hypothetical protein